MKPQIYTDEHGLLKNQADKTILYYQIFICVYL